jgi:DNA-binding MarR family transcriptional regulator
VLDPDLYEVQRLYPMIYLACHIDHVRSSSTKWRLSSHDSSILAHLDTKEGMSPRSLATHLGVVPSTLSAAISRLTKLGYIESKPLASDRRRKELRLTALGAKAMASTSVLDSERVRAMLVLLSPDERQAAVQGLAILAKAARQLKKTK